MTELSYAEASEAFSYNSLTGELIWKKRTSNRIKIGETAGTVITCNGLHYWSVCLNRKKVLNHQVVWLLQTGHWPEDQIDHIDGNPLNNRIENLRECSQAQNTKNQKRHRHNTSGINGVALSKGKWRAYIGRKATHLGTFATKEEAIAARLRAEERLHYSSGHGKR